MSDSTAIALIIATFLLGLGLFIWPAKVAADIAGQVVTGVVNGVPISVRQRRLVLYQTWVNFAVATVATPAFGIVAVLEIAGLTGAPGIKTLGYLAAFIGGVAMVGSGVSFIAELIEYRSVLREQERE